ncbi:membrane protein [Palaeococcus ferrophilus]|uniref:membrane protein n=1 Tax=Palaeococcus ferrophilus TaxID=83868 RepID=UPI00064E32CE|nr:membrane protein [Palaeococcus ferrophilus]
MITYEPIMLAMPLARRITEFIARERRLPEGDELRVFLKEFGLEESCLDRGMAVYRNPFVLAIILPGTEHAVVDVISSSGELSDALEVIAYHDKEVNAYYVEIVPASEVTFEGNVGLEPAIIDAESFEMESYPVFGHFEERDDGIYLILDEEAYSNWKASEKLHTCPICGAEGVAWKGEKAFCPSCGFGFEVVRK